jgi:WD40 repeat protein
MLRPDLIYFRRLLTARSNGADKPAVRDLAAKLEERGLACWLDEWNLIPGNPWQPAIEEALGQCDTCLVFFGPHGLGPWHNEEMRLALQRRVNSRERKLRVLPVILPGGQRAKESDLPGFLQGTTWVEFRNSLDEEDAFYRVVCGIKGIPPGRRQGAPILEGECPYLGLKTFQPEDAPLFFGRTAKGQELIERLRNNFGTPNEERFLALIGASGSGKSSLALAGLIPSIQRGGLPASAKWPLVRCRPGTRPWESLQIALSTNQQIALHMAALPTLIIRPEDEQRRLHLTAQLALHDQPEQHRLFILIDQFEEIPFLEHALFKLWEMRAARRLTANDYTDMGRLGGALDAHAEEFFNKTLSVQEQSLCRHLLVDLVHPGEGAADTKKRVSLDDIAPTDAARAVLKKLADARLVTTDRDDPPEAAQAELAHEALISGWRRLGEWVNENREKSRLKERLLDSAREWQRSSKKEDFLYRGAQLATAQEIFGSSEDLPKIGREFLEASIFARHRERQDRQREQRNRQRLLAMALGVFALLAIGATVAAVFGFRQKGEAERQATLATEARQIAENQTAAAREAGHKIALASSRANVSLAQYLLENGKHVPALAYLAQALRLDPRNERAAALIGAMLSQANWAIPVAGTMRHDDAVYSAKFSTDGQRVVTASKDNTARVWDAATGKAIGEPMRHDQEVHSAQFSADGQRVLTSADDTACVWDAVTGKAIGEPMRHGSYIHSAEFSADGQRVVTASDDHTARVWDAATGKAIGEPMRPGGAVYSAQFSADGQRVMTASTDKTARVWDMATGKAIGERMRHDEAVLLAQFSADGQRVVTASWDKTARVWDAATGKAIGQPMRHDSYVRSAQFSADGQRVVTASDDNTARVWDAATGKAIGEPMRHDGEVFSAQFSADGQRVVTASRDKTARVWDAATGKAIGEPMRHDGEARSAQFSADGQRVVTASEDRTARVWDAANRKAIEELMRHDDQVLSAQFSANGRRVVTASRDKTARVWDAATGKAIGEPMRHGNVVNSAQFSANGQRVVTAVRGKDGAGLGCGYR